MSDIFTRFLRHSVVILVLAASLAPNVAAQEEPPVNPLIQAGLEALGWGLSLETRDSVFTIEVDGKLLPTTVEYWSANYPTEEDDFSVRVEYIETENLLGVWRAMRQGNDSGPLVADGALGDVSILGKSSLKILRGDLVAILTLNRLGPSSERLRWPDDQETLTEIGTAIIQAFDAAGADKLPPFMVNFTPLSLEPPIQILIEPDGPEGYGLFYSLRDLNADPREFIFQSDLIEFSATKDLVDNTDLPPGSYLLSLAVRDGFGREVEMDYNIKITSDEEVLIVSSSQDTTLSQRYLHQNDGANPLLTLEKIQGKPSRSSVFFDLSGAILNGLSRATLVLSIEPNEHVDGWGNGRTISAQAITTPWQEGNGWSFGLKKKDQFAGNGSGATWFSPADQDISNDSANSAVNWDGAADSVYPPTAPSVQISNFQSGEVAFDVTTDVLNGAEHGWLILKDQENVGSKISFYSREGAAAAGNPDLAPRLILEFGDPVASGASPSDGFLAKAGLGSIGTKFRATQNGGELRSVREVLQENPVAALATEQLLYEATRTNPVLNITARAAYRSWLAEDSRIAAVPAWFS